MSEHDHAHGEHDEGEHHDLPVAARVRRLEERVIAAGLASDEEIDAYLAKLYASASPVNGARMAARAWTDPGYRELLLSDGNAAAAELGFRDLSYQLRVVAEHAADPQRDRVHAVLLLPRLAARAVAWLVQELRLPVADGAGTTVGARGVRRRAA